MQSTIQAIETVPSIKIIAVRSLIMLDVFFIPLTFWLIPVLGLMLIILALLLLPRLFSNKIEDNTPHANSNPTRPTV